MNINKVLLASIMFPTIHFKELLGAITFPILIFTCNWILGVKFANDYIFLPWFLYVFQFYAISLLLTNCVFLITKNEVPKFLEKQSVYFKCTILLIGYSVVTFLVKYILFLLVINIFGISESNNFWKLDEITNFVSTIIVFSLFFVIPHYIYTGQIRLVYVLKHLRIHFIGITLIILIIEIIKASIGYMFIDTAALSVIFLGSIMLLIFKTFGYILISFCYLEIFSKKTPFNIEV